ncbi:hypothetical protein NC981_02405 [Leptolyngbya sp. DQ-M1]|uniref:hypothetical protein n=1 Tax=Leptolyngbya sp. DQ-M1 TaxID=2933920 RepID=UPI003298ADCF
MSTSDTIAALALLFFFNCICAYPVFPVSTKTRVVKLTLLNWFSESNSSSETVLVLHLAFANLGNQPSVSLNVGLAFEGSRKNRVLLPEQENERKPMLLKPSDIQPETYKFVCPESLFSFVLDQDSRRQEIRPIIRFEILDSTGKHHERNLYGCIVKVENFKVCGTSYSRYAQVTLHS